MEKIFEIMSTSGPYGSFVAIVLLIFVFVRKQELGIRTEINGSLQRLQTDLAEANKKIDELEDEVDKERTKRREAEDREDIQRRRADAAESILGIRD